MYRLLIVTENHNVNDMINGMQGWEKLGFKPPRLRATSEEAVECLRSEIEEFLEARKSGDSARIERELGDVLFSAVNVGRMAGVDCEKALKESTDVFARRFTLAEKMANEGGRDVTTLSAEEWDGYYRKAKKELQMGE